MQCRNTLEFTPIAVISRSKGGVTPIRAAEAQSTLLQIRLAPPERIAPCSTQKSWRLAFGRLPHVSKMAQRLTSCCTPRKNWMPVAKSELFSLVKLSFFIPYAILSSLLLSDPSSRARCITPGSFQSVLFSMHGKPLTLNVSLLLPHPALDPWSRTRSNLAY